MAFKLHFTAGAGLFEFGDHALFFLILFMVVRPLMAMLVTSAPAPAESDTPALPASVGQVEAAMSGKQPAQILDMAKNNPANTAVVVKQWLKSNA